MKPLPPIAAPPNKKAEAIDKILSRAQALLAEGRAGEALAELRRKSEAALAHPVGQVLLGQAEGLSGRPEKALAAFSAACRLAPAYPEAHYNRGLFLRRLGRLDEALAAYDTALRHRPSLVAARFNRGVVLREMGRLSDAIAVYDALLIEEPSRADLHFNRAGILVGLDRLSEAVAAFERALKLNNPGAIGALDKASAQGVDLALSSLYLRLDQPQEALAAVDRLLRAGGETSASLLNRGLALARLERLEESLAAYDKAIALDRTYLGAQLNRGVLLKRMDLLEEALAQYDELLARDPSNIEAHSNRAATLHALSRFEEAEAAFSEALKLDPDFAEAHAGRAFTRLLSGEFMSGWDDYEYRDSDRTKLRIKPAELPALHLRAVDLAGKSLLIRREQGLGDALQFGRYFPLLHDIASSIAIELPPRMGRILAPLLAGVRVESSPPSGTAYDREIRLLSLPRLFAADLANLPAQVPYLHAEAERIEFWRQRIGTSGFRIGINWQGNPKFPSDRGRSIPLRHFASLAALPGVRLISLQKVHGLDQLENLPPGMRVENLGADYLSDEADLFVDGAAIMQSLDLIVTSDTATVHLAGALGRPTFLALPKVPDWRWLLEREDCPWYPSMRLFRQSERGDWAGVFERLAQAVSERMSTKA